MEIYKYLLKFYNPNELNELSKDICKRVECEFNITKKELKQELKNKKYFNIEIKKEIKNKKVYIILNKIEETKISENDIEDKQNKKIEFLNDEIKININGYIQIEDINEIKSIQDIENEYLKYYFSDMYIYHDRIPNKDFDTTLIRIYNFCIEIFLDDNETISYVDLLGEQMILVYESIGEYKGYYIHPSFYKPKNNNKKRIFEYYKSNLSFDI